MALFIKQAEIVEGYFQTIFCVSLKFGIIVKNVNTNRYDFITDTTGSYREGKYKTLKGIEKNILDNRGFERVTNSVILEQLKNDIQVVNYY